MTSKADHFRAREIRERQGGSEVWKVRSPSKRCMVCGKEAGFAKRGICASLKSVSGAKPWVNRKPRLIWRIRNCQGTA